MRPVASAGERAEAAALARRVGVEPRQQQHAAPVRPHLVAPPVVHADTVTDLAPPSYWKPSTHE